MTCADDMLMDLKLGQMVCVMEKLDVSLDILSLRYIYQIQSVDDFITQRNFEKLALFCPWMS